MGDRLIVCGGRDFAGPRTGTREQRQAAVDWIWEVLDWFAPPLIVHGACPTGVDRIAHEWAFDRGVDLVLVPALWKPHGKPAGPRRNKLMATLGISDALLAFPGGRGTESMVREARRAGLKIIDKRAVQPPA